VDYDGGATVTEDGVVIVAESYVGGDYGDVGGTVGAYDQGKIGDVAGGCGVMVVFGTAGVEVRTGGFEVGRIALRDLMNVEGVFARREIFDVQRDFNALRRA